MLKSEEDHSNGPTTKKSSVKIFDLSNYKLTPYEVSLLEKGLSLCPEHQADSFNLFIDLHRFTRKLSLNRHFNIQSVKQDGKKCDSPEAALYLDPGRIGKHKKVHPKSSFYPAETQGHYIQTFHEMLAGERRKLTTKNRKN